MHKYCRVYIFLLLFSHPVVSDSLWSRGLLALPVPHYLLEFAQVHVLCTGDAQPFHPLLPSSPSFPASGTFPMSRLFASDDQNTRALASASVLPTSIEGLISFETDWFGSPCCPRGFSRVRHHSSKASVLRHHASLLEKEIAAHSGTLAWKILWMEKSDRLSMRSQRAGHDWATSLHFTLLYGSFLTTEHDHWEDHSLDYKDLCPQSNVSAFQHTVQVCHGFPAKKQSSFDFTPAVTIRSDLRAQEEEICHYFHFPPFYLPWSNGAGCLGLSFLSFPFLFLIFLLLKLKSFTTNFILSLV